MKLSRFLLCCLWIIAGASASPTAAQNNKRVALIDFDFGIVESGWAGNWDIGKEIANLVKLDLVRNGTLSVTEHDTLDGLLLESQFSIADRTGSDNAARLGKILGVNAMIVGSITQFGLEEDPVNGSKKVNVVIDARLIDVKTGTTLATASGKGISAHSGLRITETTAGRASRDLGSDSFQDTTIGEASQEAVHQLTAELIEQAEKVVMSATVVHPLGTNPADDVTANPILPAGAPRASRCDLNADTFVDNLDLQSLTFAIRNESGARGFDVNLDGKIDAVDVQLLTNVILGVSGCVATATTTF